MYYNVLPWSRYFLKRRYGHNDELVEIVGKHRHISQFAVAGFYQ